MELYSVAAERGRFSQRYTAFAREGWDPSFVTAGESVKQASAVTRPGYGREDQALQTGAWAVARQQQPSSSSNPDYAGSDKEGIGEPGDPGNRNLLTRRLKQAARLYGASLVGVTRVNPLWVYACDQEEKPLELPEGIDTAVVIAVEMDYERICTSPSMVAGAATGNGYSKMAFTAACVARYLTELGWRAIACGNDTALSIPLAIDAGLGEPGRNGLLITPLYGPRVRLCKVFTDAPLIADRPISFGVREFCDVCMKCVTTCPSRSISPDPMTRRGLTPSNNPGVLKWYVNPETCLTFWRKNGVSCSNCIRSCPFNKASGWIHDLARALVRPRSHLLGRFLVLLDDLCGYGTARSARKAMKKFI